MACLERDYCHLCLFTGILEVREGVTSEGKLLAGGDSYDTYEGMEDQGTMGFHSTKGLYIRLQVENGEGNPQKLQFVYGIFQKAEKTATCKAGSCMLAAACWQCSSRKLSL